IEKTVKAYESVADEIATLMPDTIVITSPHSVMYADCFHVSPGEKASGSFAKFDAGSVSFTEEYDSELVQKITEISYKDPMATTLGERDSSLDHGTLVPLYFIRQKYKEGKIVRIGLSGLPFEDHYRLGQRIAEAAEELNSKIVFVASGDLSHKLQEYGPYGFAKEGVEYDKKLMDVCERGALGELMEFNSHFCDRAAECGHRSFIIMSGALDGYDVKARVYSHEDVTGVGYGICSFYPTEKNTEREFLRIRLIKKEKEFAERRANEDAYVRLARETINTYIRTGKIIDIPSDCPDEITGRKAGAFVSIHKNDNLRGCIGTICATRENLAKEIIHNAISASTEDPRFSPITEDELDTLEISVDVLGEAEDIDSPSLLDVKRYGVIVSTNTKRGLLLPDLDGVDTVEDQIAIAKSKAGILDGEKYKLQRFEVIRHY
ncbi:MAG: AmmeMemoRadiSam system protein A, partial [Lachnospiraceae bacterium]|nr:AmmeMemoRadiSam system protein A [Lachnospiraceae bacterium]